MISNCMNQYKQASEDCDNLSNWIKQRFSDSENNEKNSSCTTLVRTTAAFNLSIGVGCLFLGPKPAACCLIPGAVALTSSELSVCAICVTNVCKKAVLHRTTSESKFISVKEREAIAVNLDSPFLSHSNNK